MSKKILEISIAILAVAMLASSAFAANPTIVNDVWLVIPFYVDAPSESPANLIVPGKVWTSEDGTILHSKYTQISTYVAHTPSDVPPGTIRWGTMMAESDLVFDTITNKGSVNMKITLTLKDAWSTIPTKYPATNYPNTYGKGTLEGTLVAEVTSLNPYVKASLNCPVPGDGQGYFIATHGTGDFANAKLAGDVTLSAGQAQTQYGPISIEYIFFGSHINHPYNEGTLTLHNPGPSA